MGIKQGLTVKKMSSLRTYGQLRQKYLSSKNKSGSGTDEVKKPTWPYFDSLSFKN